MTDDTRSDWAAFHVYNDTNPDLYGRLVSMALGLRSSGFKRFGIAWLFEVIRYEYAVKYGEDFKIDNSLRAAYARFIMANEPALRGIFTTRRSKLDGESTADIMRSAPHHRPRRQAADAEGDRGHAGHPAKHCGQDDARNHQDADPYAGQAVASVRRRPRACGGMVQDPGC